jgi:hypothetical protein
VHRHHVSRLLPSRCSASKFHLQLLRMSLASGVALLRCLPTLVSELLSPASVQNSRAAKVPEGTGISEKGNQAAPHPKKRTRP